VIQDDRSVKEALRSSRWLLDVLLEQFPEGSVNVFDRDFRYLYAAGTGLARVGLSPDLLIGRRLDDVFSAESVARVWPFYVRAFAGEVVIFTLTVFGREYSMHARPFPEADGTVDAIVVVARELPAQVRGVEELTPHQREVAALIAAGLTNQQIAERLQLGAATVRSDIGQIMSRLGFVGRVQIAIWAIRCGLYRPEVPG
jgi:DNA-binding CsgD family transcriptional regulator